MEQLGDAVAGRYLLVAPSWARAARRQYHAVDLLLDRTVAVRFDPRDTHDGRAGVLLHTADGYRVLDEGVFAGSSFVVVVDSLGGVSGDDGVGAVGVSLADLERWAAIPCFDGPRGAAGGAARSVRRTLLGALAVVVMLTVVMTVATLFHGPPAPSRPARSGTVSQDQAVWVPAAR